MPYKLIIGNKNYSSWSMRAWLLLRFVGASFQEVTAPIYRPGARDAVKAHGGQTGLVPVLMDGDVAIWDTMAIAECLYERHRQVWPSDFARRARARSWCGEVHSSFGPLRDAMPVNTRGRNRVARRTPAATADVARVREIWASAGRFAEGPWLFGEFCAADIMFAPIATRFRTYDVELDGPARDYGERLLAHPLVDEWLTLGETESDVIEAFELPRRATASG